MFSLTQLVRKSKDIFDKLVKEEIQKAVILRDGKPNFILLDFNKYQKIMKNYQEIKCLYENNKSSNNEVEIEKIKKVEEMEKSEIREDNILNNKDEIKKDNISTQLESLNLDPEFEQQLKQQIEERRRGEIKEFWN
jgi:hypothetical protein